MENLNILFGLHPSLALQNLYKEKYWQLQEPSKAKVIFLGLDANWRKDIEKENPHFFEKIKEYLKDGIRFWENEGVHHPFLLDEYRKGDGYRFHSQFSKLGIKPEYAKYISFAELLDVPTFGMSTAKENKQKFEELLNESHLTRLNKVLTKDQNKLIFIPKAFHKKYLRKFRTQFDIFKFGLEVENTRGENFFNVHNHNNNFIFLCNHFSASITDDFLSRMGIIVRSFLGELKEQIWWEVSYIGSWNGERVEEKRYINACNVVEVKNILSKYLSLYRIENDLKQLTFLPANNEQVDTSLVWD